MSPDGLSTSKEYCASFTDSKQTGNGAIALMPAPGRGCSSLKGSASCAMMADLVDDRFFMRSGPTFRAGLAGKEDNPLFCSSP